MAKIYKNVTMIDSNVGEKSLIGDNSIVQWSDIGNYCQINRHNYIHRSAIGEYTYTGMNTQIRSSSIGKFCSISWNVSIGGGDHKYDRLTTSLLSRYYEMIGDFELSKEELIKTYANQKRCVIGNDVLISTGAIILRNVSVGNGCVIGAGSVIARNIPPYCVVSGNPAIIIRKRFSKEIICEIESIKWWDWDDKTISDNIDVIYSSKVDDNIIKKLKEINDKIKNTN